MSDWSKLLPEQKGRPATGTYSPTQWDTGEVLLDWHDQVPSTLPDGVYSTHLLVSDQVTGQSVGDIALATVSAPKECAFEMKDY